MSNQMKFAPWREPKDIIGQAENYAVPDFKDPARLGNRITNNLLYYQTNYFVVFAAILVLVGILHPVQFTIGLISFVGIFIGYNVLADKNVYIQRLKRDRPFRNLIVILFITGFFLRLIGSMIVFIFSICLPLTSFRTRNLKNKIANQAETIGVSRTPMGFLLEQLDMLFDDNKKKSDDK